MERARDYLLSALRLHRQLQLPLTHRADQNIHKLAFHGLIIAQGNPIVVDHRLLIELLHELPELVKRISYNLNGISTGIYQILQDKYDGLAQQEYQ